MPAEIASASMFLRTDGTLLVVQHEKSIELRLQPEQCLRLGADLLRLALMLDPALAERIAIVLENTYVTLPADLAHEQPTKVQ